MLKTCEIAVPIHRACHLLYQFKATVKTTDLSLYYNVLMQFFNDLVCTTFVYFSINAFFQIADSNIFF